MKTSDLIRVGPLDLIALATSPTPGRMGRMEHLGGKMKSGPAAASLATSASPA
jgi:hypothetical protein